MRRARLVAPVGWVWVLLVVWSFLKLGLGYEPRAASMFALGGIMAFAVLALISVLQKKRPSVVSDVLAGGVFLVAAIQSVRASELQEEVAWLIAGLPLLVLELPGKAAGLFASTEGEGENEPSWVKWAGVTLALLAGVAVLIESGGHFGVFDALYALTAVVGLANAWLSRRGASLVLLGAALLATGVLSASASSVEFILEALDGVDSKALAVEAGAEHFHRAFFLLSAPVLGALAGGMVAVRRRPGEGAFLAAMLGAGILLTLVAARAGS